MRTHLASFFADCGDVAVLKTRDKIVQPDGLALLAIHSNKRRKSRERVHLANAGARYRRFSLIAAIKPATRLTILYADHRDRRKSPGVPGAAVAYKIADIWHVRYRRLNSPAFAKSARSRDFLRSSLGIACKVNHIYHMTF